MRRWWKRPVVRVDFTAGQEATAARVEAEQRWAQVRSLRARQRAVGNRAVRVRDENHFAPKIRQALEGR